MASGRINGVCTGNAASKYDFWIEWSSTPYIGDGYSLVSATAYLKRNDGQSSSAYNLDVKASRKIISINGETATSTTKGIDTRNNKLVTIASISNVKVYHDEDGFKSIEISASFPSVSSVNLSGGKASKIVALDVIDLSAPSFSSSPRIVSKTQTSVEVFFSSPDPLDGIYYSIDWQRTWVEVDSTVFKIDGLSPYTDYSIAVKIVRAYSQLFTIETVTGKTLPIYVTDIIVQEPVIVSVGASKNVNCEFLPENASIKEVSIESSNKSIIWAFGNTISGMSKGDAVLTLTAVDGGGASVAANASAVSAVTGVIISPTEITMANGDTVDLAVNVFPADANNKNVSLSASDENLVLIEGTKVTALANGVAEITATTEDGGFTATAILTISGDYTWFEYVEPIEILNTEDIANIQSNITTIRNMLLSNGYSVADLEDEVATKGLHFINVLDFLQNIEYNLDRISDNDCQSIYYVEPKTVGDMALNKADIWRWVQILNDMYGILSGQFGKWGRLVCSDGYPTIGGKKIVLRGDVIGD
jgi:hypothetical protein